MRNSTSSNLGFDGGNADRSLFLADGRGLRSRHLRLVPAVACLIGLLAACSDNTSTPSDAGSAKDATNADSSAGDGAGRDTGNTDSGTADTGAADGSNADVDMSDVGMIETGPPPSLCDGKPKTPLPYAVLTDFTQVSLIGPEVINFNQVLPAGCDVTTFPPIPPPNVPPEAGTDAGEAGAADAGADTGVAEAGADATTDTGASTEAGGEASTEASAPLPACWEFLYNPSCITSASGLCWAGVIFQAPGSTPNAGAGGATGICIGTGATQIKFSARASRDGARIKFGSTRPGIGSTETFLNVTTSWAMYSVMIPVGEPYNDYTTSGGVWNGFSIVVEPQDHIGDGSPGDVGTYILVKDVTWSM
jgi:hypothetical protein